MSNISPRIAQVLRVHLKSHEYFLRASRDASRYANIKKTKYSQSQVWKQ